MVHLKLRPDQDSVFETLRRAIVRGEIPPGGRIIERDAAAELGVSRTPIREAIARLQRDRLISPVAGRQRNLLQVAPLTLRDLQQASAATAALEGIGARAAASQPVSDRRTLADQLDTVLDSTAREVTRADGAFAHALELDERFHRMLTDDFLERSVAGCLESARTHVYRYVWMFSPKTRVGASRFKAEHAPIVEALRRGDAGDVCAAVEANWSGFSTRIAPFLADV
jgi:DNA-binding GntR family transcriptional regulator